MSSDWRWNRLHARTAKTVAAKDNDPTIPVRLDALIARADVSERDKAFFLSLKGGWDKYNSLTTGQSAALKKSEERYSAETSQKRNEWAAAFTPVMRERMNLCAQYYSKTGYFTDLANRILTDSTFIPSEKQYNALCNNKYANRLVEQSIEGPKFNVGEVVMVRSNRTYGDADLSVVTITGVNDVITAHSANRGRRYQYQCMVFATGTEISYFEGDLKPYREKKGGK